MVLWSLAIFSFILGLGLGYFIEWLLNNHHRKLLVFIGAVMAAWIIILSIDAIFNPENILLQTYSEWQGWVDFAFAFAGFLLGSTLEYRHELNKKYKIIIHLPRQSPAYVHAENPKLYGHIKVVPEKYKERKNERMLAGGLTKKSFTIFLNLPHREQLVLINNTLYIDRELNRFYELIRGAAVPELAAQLKNIACDIKNERGKPHITSQLNLMKLHLIQMRMEKLVNQ